MDIEARRVNWKASAGGVVSTQRPEDDSREGVRRDGKVSEEEEER